MIARLLKKEFLLCLHPTNLLFLCFCTFVFIPNYPYEVAFFFTGLGIFFISLTARENGDSAFSCTMPVRKREVVIARILFCAIFQVALLLLTCVTVTLKGVLYPPEMQMNAAGSNANFALIGYGGLLFGLYNIIFFPAYFKNPNRVGIPFLIAATVQFVLIGVLIALRFIVPFFSETLTAPFGEEAGAKLLVMGVGLVLYVLLTVLAALKSVRVFDRTDL